MRVTWKEPCKSWWSNHQYVLKTFCDLESQLHLHVKISSHLEIAEQFVHLNLIFKQNSNIENFGKMTGHYYYTKPLRINNLSLWQLNENCLKKIKL